MAGKLLKLLVKHGKTGKAYTRYFKTRKGYSAAKKAGGKETLMGRATGAAAPAVRKVKVKGLMQKRSSLKLELGGVSNDLKIINRNLKEASGPVRSPEHAKLFQSLTKKKRALITQHASLKRQVKAKTMEIANLSK